MEIDMRPMTQFAVVGASGKVGRVVCDLLRARGLTARPIARSLGVSLDDVEALQSTFAGVDGAFVMTPFDMAAPDLHQREAEIADRLASALRAAKPRVVALSGTSAHLGSAAGSGYGAALLEAALNSADLPELTCLRGAFFMENLLQGLASIRADGIFRWAFRPDRPTPMVAAADIARRAVDILTAEAFAEPRVQEMLGAADRTLEEATRVLGRSIGRPAAHYIQTDYVQARQEMIGSGMSESFADAVMQTARGFNAGEHWEQEPRSPRNTTKTTLEAWAATATA
jgi:uncharacterized protein YbjT (DUF2867 family)